MSDGMAGGGKAKAKHPHRQLIPRPNRNTLGQSWWRDTFPQFSFHLSPRRFSQTPLVQHGLAVGVAAQAQITLPWDNHFWWYGDPA